MQRDTRAVAQLALDEMVRPRASKWTPTVMLHLRRRTLRFSELQREIGTISQKALTASLRTLERDGLVLRTSFATIPPRVDYELTPLGIDALVLFEGFERFALTNWQSVIEARQLFDARNAGPVQPEIRSTALR